MGPVALIENCEDIPLFLAEMNALLHVRVFTPSVAVREKLANIGVSAERIDAPCAGRDEVVALDLENRRKVVRLRESIADCLNSLPGYPFRGCHHPDFQIIYWKRLLFAIEYRHFLLSKLLGLDEPKSIPEGVSVVDDVRRLDGSIAGRIGEVLGFSLFPQGQRSFSNVLSWAWGDRVHPIRSVQATAFDEGQGDVVRRMRGLLMGMRQRTSQVLSDAIFFYRFRKSEVFLCDLNYLQVEQLAGVEGKNAYHIRRHVLDAERWRYLSAGENGKAHGAVQTVVDEVVGPLRKSGMFCAGRFDYAPIILNIVRSFVFQEVASFYWAERKACRLARRMRPVAAHSDVAYQPSTYSVFTLLKNWFGVPMYSYPHGTEGYYDYFWQERMTTAAASCRFVGSDEQRRHFEAQQDRHYQKRYHSQYAVHRMRYDVNPRGLPVVAGKRFDVVYAMNEARSNTLYTIINYPDAFDLCDSQRAILMALCGGADSRGLSVCIRPPNGMTKEEGEYLFANLPGQPYVSWDVRFPQLLSRAESVVVDSPLTAFLQALDRGKAVLCLNCVNSVSEDLKKVMKNRGVRYREAKLFREADVRDDIERFLGERTKGNP